MVALSLAVAVLGQSLAPIQIGIIDWFGQTGLKISHLGASLPVHVGDTIDPKTWPKRQGELARAIKKAIGKKPTEISIVLSDVHGKAMVFIGLPGPTVEPARYRSSPFGKARFTSEVLKLGKEFDTNLLTAVRSGHAMEDDSHGYALFDDPTLHAIQLKMREFTVSHEPLVREVLETSSSVQDRQLAAMLLGYADRSSGQIQGLVGAVSDSDGEVRNNATRALGVIARADPKGAKLIPAGPFIAMLHSGIWTDRNKSAAVLDSLTQARDKKVLDLIRTRALPSLLEMAEWHNPPHAATARAILGRVAGIDETRLQDLIDKGDLAAIVEPLHLRIGD